MYNMQALEHPWLVQLALDMGTQNKHDWLCTAREPRPWQWQCACGAWVEFHLNPEHPDEDAMLMVSASHDVGYPCMAHSDEWHGDEADSIGDSPL